MDEPARGVSRFRVNPVPQQPDPLKEPGSHRFRALLLIHICPVVRKDRRTLPAEANPAIRLTSPHPHYFMMTWTEGEETVTCFCGPTIFSISALLLPASSA